MLFSCLLSTNTSGLLSLWPYWFSQNKKLLLFVFHVLFCCSWVIIFFDNFCHLLNTTSNLSSPISFIINTLHFFRVCLDSRGFLLCCAFKCSSSLIHTCFNMLLLISIYMHAVVSLCPYWFFLQTEKLLFYFSLTKSIFVKLPFVPRIILLLLHNDFLWQFQ